MPSEPEDFEARMTALENEVRVVRADAAAAVRADVAAARVLAGGTDRDVADLKVKLDVHTKMLGALRETQLEQGERLNSLEVETRQGFAKLSTGMTYITTLLERLDQSGNAETARALLRRARARTRL